MTIFDIHEYFVKTKGKIDPKSMQAVKSTFLSGLWMLATAPAPLHHQLHLQVYLLVQVPLQGLK